MNLMRRIHPATTEVPSADISDGKVRTREFASGLYMGWIRHRRYAPRAHTFTYKLFLAYLDLSEIDQVFAGRWLWSVGRRNVAEFRRSDYLGDPDVPLDTAVRDCVEQHTDMRPTGPIRLLTHLRYFGKCFNPVSFYYCFADDGRTLQTVVAEITNTTCMPGTAASVSTCRPSWPWSTPMPGDSAFPAMRCACTWRCCRLMPPPARANANSTPRWCWSALPSMPATWLAH